MKSDKIWAPPADEFLNFQEGYLKASSACMVVNGSPHEGTRRPERRVWADTYCHSATQFDYLRPHGLQHARPAYPSPTPRVCSNSCPSSQWCHPAISSSAAPFSSRLQSFPASGSFPMSQFTSGGQRIGVSTPASVLPMNILDWLPLGRTGWISLQSKGLSRVFSNTTVQKHQFFGAQPFFYCPPLTSTHDYWKNRRFG